MKNILMILLCMMVLAGCETMKGLGKDMEKAGKHIEKAVDKASTGTRGI